MESVSSEPFLEWVEIAFMQVVDLSLHPSFKRSSLFKVDIIALQKTAFHIRQIAGPGSQPFERGLFVTEGLQERIRKLLRHKWALRQSRNGLFNFYSVHFRLGLRNWIHSSFIRDIKHTAQPVPSAGLQVSFLFGPFTFQDDSIFNSRRRSRMADSASRRRVSAWAGSVRSSSLKRSS